MTTKQARPQEVLPTPEDGETEEWARKVEIAREARRMGQALRKGRPATFSARTGIRLNN